MTLISSLPLLLLLRAIGRAPCAQPCLWGESRAAWTTPTAERNTSLPFLPFCCAAQSFCRMGDVFALVLVLVYVTYLAAHCCLRPAGLTEC